jgi:hypothetical protein
LYEVLSGTPVSGIQLPQAQAQRLIEWLELYKELPYKVLATLSDGEKSIITAMNSSWPDLTFHGKSSSLEKAWLFPQANYQ